VTAPTLIFVWGNPSRGDDALGPLFGEHFATLAARHPEWGEIEFQTDFQLQVEHALDLHDRERVLFVDASHDTISPCSLQRIDALKDQTFTTHAMSPQSVLQVYADIEDGDPPASWLLAIRGESFELGEELSDVARRNLEAALAAAAEWLELQLAGTKKVGAGATAQTDQSDAFKEWHAWHTQRIEALTAADGWLTLIGLFWLDNGTYRVGAGATCDIVLPTGPDLLGSLQVSGTQAIWHPDGGEPAVLASDASGTASIVRCERLSFFIIERDARLALRLRNEHAPARLNFDGIDCFDYNPELRIAAQWDGQIAEFSWHKEVFRFTPLNPSAEPLHFVFADLTSGKQTYGGGRFLYAGVSANTLTLDFNRAINPPCAFTEFAVCPLPPSGNRLPFPVTAGEMRYLTTT
jgi:hydrogenase maturation protease